MTNPATRPTDADESGATERDEVADDVEAADRANGEPGASTDEHRTGVEQAEENRRNDPPA